jgi:hypothetical protein
MFRRLKGYARFLFACAMAYGLFRFWISPIWDWSGQMAVTGNRLVTRQEITDRLKIPHKTALYRLNPQYIATQLEQVPAVSRVAVRRWLFPARLELTIIERQALVEVADDQSPGADDAPTPSPTPSTASAASPVPAPSPTTAGPMAPAPAAAVEGGLRRWIDQEGVVFAAPPRLMSARFGILVHTDLPPGSHLPPTVQNHLFELLNAWPHDQGGRLDLRDPKDVFASIGSWPVRLGEVDDVQLKFTTFQNLQPLATRYKDRLKYINLRFPNSPTLMLKTGAEIKPGEGGRSDASPAPNPSPTAAPVVTTKPTAKATAKPDQKPAPKSSPHAKPN